VNGIVSVASGMPFTVNDFDNFNGSGEFIERPDLVANPFAGTSTPYAFLKLSAFQAPCSAPDLVNLSCAGVPHFGSSGRNKFYGPHFRDFDLGLAKDTKLSERVTMQVRIDAFNVFNHPNFANPVLPNFIVDWTTNGTDANGRGIGFLPLTLTPDVGAQNPYLGGGGPRNFELAVRFTF